jgi:hypothetical protein
LDDFGRSKIYIIDHKPSWKENQRQKRERFWKLQNRSNMDLLKRDVDDFSCFSQNRSNMDLLKQDVDDFSCFPQNRSNMDLLKQDVDDFS